MPPRDLFSVQRHRVDLVYGDVTGQASARTVDVHRGYVDDETGSGYLGAWCLMRNAWRTFRDDRVREWVVIGGPAPAHFSLLQELHRLTEMGASQMGDSHGKRTGEIDKAARLRTATKVVARDAAELTAMVGLVVYMAWADGRLAKTEARTIDRLIEAWGKDFQIPELLAEVVRGGVSRADYLESLTAIASAPVATRAAVLAGVTAVASASAGIKEDEAVVLLEVAGGLGIDPDPGDLC